MKKFAAGIVLYNPSQEEIENIFAYSAYLDSVILYDNSEVETKADWGKYSNIEYYCNNVNDGMCKAINFMISLCIERGITYLFTFDQDSIFHHEDAEKLMKLVSDDKYVDVAIFVPRINYINSNSSLESISPQTEFVEWAITSGQLLNVDILAEKHIFYDEKYFIDRCDKDFCDQVRNAGCRILRNNHSILFQHLGEQGRFGRYEHSAIRHYYSFRNRFYYNGKYFSGPKSLLFDLLQTSREIIQILLFEREPVLKIKQLLYAYSDYKNNRMYKRIDNQ